MVLGAKKARKLLAAASIAAAVSGCMGAERSPGQTGSSLALGTFEGVLPCADCVGIRTVLRLYAEQPSGRPDRFELTEIYLGTRDGDRTVEKSGRWTILRGSATRRDATVFQLDFDRPDTHRDFLKVGDDELRLLDRNQHEISLPVPHSLYRVLKESSISAVMLSERDAGRTIDVAPEQLIVIRLTGNRTTGYGWTLTGPGASVLTSLGEPTYSRDTSAAGVPGAGGVETWSFRASRAGREELHFEYRRPWEPDAAATQALSYTINVR